MTESIFVPAVVIAIVDLVKQIEARDWKGTATIVGAALVGGIAGYFAIEGLTIPDGVVAGLSAAGIYRVGMAASGR